MNTLIPKVIFGVAGVGYLTLTAYLALRYRDTRHRQVRRRTLLAGATCTATCMFLLADQWAIAAPFSGGAFVAALYTFPRAGRRREPL